MAEVTGGRLIGKSVSEDSGISSVTTDSRKDCTNSIFLAIKGESLDGHDYLEAAAANKAAALCISKEHQDVRIPQDLPVLVVDDTLKAYQALAAFHRKRLGVKIIALTGSSGKTSTKEILKAILVHAFGAEKVYATEGNTNNHVGVPQNLLKLRKSHEYAIIEMGTNHPGEIEVLGKIAAPDHGLVVSIGSAHIEFFKNTDGIAKEKSAIFANMPASGTAVIPAGGPGSAVLEKQTGGLKVLRFGNENAKNADLKVKYLGGTMDGSRFSLEWRDCGFRREISWHLTGKHQAMNAGAAALAANAVGVSPETASDALCKGVQIPGMRMRVQERDGVTWINDAYNANPESMKAGIEWLHEASAGSVKKDARVFVILGDMLEMGEAGPPAHEDILRLASSLMPGAVIMPVGPIMMKSAEKIRNADMSLRDFPDSEEAAKYVKAKLRRGDIIFLKGSRGMKLEKIENVFSK